MKKIATLCAVAAVFSSQALAQDAASHSDHVASGGQPAACQQAASQGEHMDMSQMNSAMQGMMADMDDVQKASMEAMMQMHDPMMRAMLIKDPDLAFNCGMIAHHHGAIAMAEVELRLGKDEESRKMAQQVIDAQKKENEDMTAWIEEHARQ